MHLILFDDPGIRQSLLPLAFTRPVAGTRVGILTIAEKWEQRSSLPVSYFTEDYLSQKFSFQGGDENVFVNGAVCPTDALVQAIENLPAGQSIVYEGVIIAGRMKSKRPEGLKELAAIEWHEDLTIIDALWKIFKCNAQEIKADFEIVTKDRQSAGINDPHTIVYGKENLFIEKGASLRACIINAEKGPVYIGRNARVLEGAIVSGAFALGESSVVSIGAKIRGDSTVGPFSKVGGEVGNSVIFGYSNKGHDGYLGNSVVGEWCNLGADTNTSNLKNDYGPVKLWSYGDEGFKKTSETFFGTVMGDHSKCGINTMFNTGTIIGVSANIFGAGFPRNFVPSFSWGGAGGLTTYQFKKATEVAERVMKRRGVPFTEEDRFILLEVFDRTGKYRNWEGEEV